MVMAKPRAEHGFLEKMVGSWDVTSDMSAGIPWVEEVRSLQGIWIVAEGSGDMPGGEGPATTMLTLGFDAAKGKYVGTWLGSMMDYLWVYEGEVEPDGKTLSLYTIGPSMSGEGMADYRERVTFLSDDHRTFTSAAKQPDGSWKQFMEAHYHRKS
ncbi:DUF1579 domain-containing protein [Aliirhizobium terrae]|uniref:DUF1579 domain-containing protein n=1 Tax=Terrirhizobium terrae TaxID=2926709 RepID=UPI0025757C57|nr:DUF1579 domain-containing protein [Rhizobium sp. CC-CFT758]WJH42273.1 DUF1579 domain-containing protein [Rhizobium sp. CC-CFT758]